MPSGHFSSISIMSFFAPPSHSRKCYFNGKERYTHTNTLSASALYFFFCLLYFPCMHDCFYLLSPSPCDTEKGSRPWAPEIRARGSQRATVWINKTASSTCDLGSETVSRRRSKKKGSSLAAFLFFPPPLFFSFSPSPLFSSLRPKIERMQSQWC